MQVAQQQRENLRALVCDGGDQNAWFQILPRYKINREGDVIQNASDIFLQIVMKPNEYIHCSELQPTEALREINCSFERTPWQLQLFQQCQSEASDVLFAGDAVLIFDPEYKSYLRTQNMRQVAGQPPPTSSKVSLAPSPLRDWPNSNCIWVLEREVTNVGGPVYCKSDLVRFRHLNSASFLSIAESDNGATLEASRVASNTSLFELLAIQANQAQLRNNAAVQMHREGLYFTREVYNGNLMIDLTANKSEALSVLIYRPPQELLMAAHVGVNALTHLETFIKLLARQDWAAVEHSYEFFVSITAMLGRFVQGKRLSGSLVFDDTEGNDTLKKKQVLFMEQGVLRALLIILDLTRDAEMPRRTRTRPNDSQQFRKKDAIFDQTLELI